MSKTSSTGVKKINIEEERKKILAEKKNNPKKFKQNSKPVPNIYNGRK